MDAVLADSASEEALVVTAAGYEELCADLETLRTDARREMGENLREAREDGHLAVNPALFELLEDQAQLERRIAILERQLAAAKIVTPAATAMLRSEAAYACATSPLEKSPNTNWSA